MPTPSHASNSNNVRPTYPQSLKVFINVNALRHGASSFKSRQSEDGNVVKWFDEQLKEPIKLYREKVMANKEPTHLYSEALLRAYTHLHHSPHLKSNQTSDARGLSNEFGSQELWGTKREGCNPTR